jgi:cell division septation protein DedD
MPRTEDGEFELVLGNKQLLSVFFIIAILLGVFFTMGYMMGRSAGPVTAAAGRDTSATPPVPRPDAPSAMPQDTPPVTFTPPPSAESAPGATPDASGGAAPQAPTPDAAKPGAGQPSAAGEATKITQPQPGQLFVQVSSMLAQPEAEILVEVLGKKGFRAIIAPGPNEGRYRVLVGPVTDTNDAGRVKADLEQAGFKGAFPKKY